MTTHFYEDCPAMASGDGILDIDSLDLEEWVYDCETCQYAKRVEHKSWAGGFRGGLQAALYRLDAVQAAINVGRSKLQVFRLLERDWGDVEIGPDPGFLPLLIMTIEEIMVYSCPTCDVGTSYSRTEDGADIWKCEHCGYETRIPVEDRAG